jgi:glutathione S-transferase
MAPNPRRARIFLYEKGVEVEKIEYNILAGDNIKDEYLKINPWGTLPALELDDGTVIREAPSIFRYLEAIHPEPNLLGKDPREAAEIETWERFSELQGMAAIYDFFRNQTEALNSRGLPGPLKLDLIPALVNRGKKRAAWFYEQINERLGKSEYLGSNRYTAADITAQCVIDAYNAMDVPTPDECKNVQRWHKEVGTRDSAAA